MAFQKTSIATAMALMISGPAAAGLIDFENAPSFGLDDNHALTNEYEGVTFTGGFLEASGEEDRYPQGFLNDQGSQYDLEFVATPALGNWFLRTGGEVGTRGTQDVYLQIDYSNAVNAASGQIWDIDGNENQGTEQWEVRAYDSNDILIDNVFSPIGSTNGPGSLDGLPWTFNLSGGEFNRIEFLFTGTKKRGIGLGFDNFNTSSVSVPEPGTLALMALGLVGVTVAHRRKA